MKKGNNSGNDDFSFSTGGDEFFPLNIDKTNSKDTKAPKGVKGYLKNVAKSVVNLGVKTGKHLYPEAIELGEKFKPDTTSTTNPKAYIASWKAEAKKYGDIVKDIGKSTLKDAKEAIRTGKFVKTEDEKNNAEEMFGDMFGDSGFDFDGDSASYSNDIVGDDSSFDLGSDEGDTGATLNTSETIVKSSYASARINAQLSEKTNATIVGASQTQIKSDRAMFAQNLEISQEQHRQKMLMMTNIATNLGKVIEQGNVSIKAQMEFSAKQLAFSQDLAAMLKEIRDVQWSTVKPKKPGDITKSKFQKIFGDGKTSNFNLKEFGKNFLNASKSEAAGGAFDMLGTGKEMIDMMMDMGGGAGALKSMIGDMLFESAVNGILGKRATEGASTLNSKLEGLPGVVNRKLGQISRSGSPVIDKILNKLPFNLGSKLDYKQIAGWAHVDTDVKIKSGRFNMDPSEVHPFDNAAHKALTEVIPWQLAKIDAGINRTEQEFFDYKNNKWKKISSVQTNLNKTKDDVLEYSSGYNEIKERIKFGAGIEKSYNLVAEELLRNPVFITGKANRDNISKDKAQEYANTSVEARKYIIDNQKKLIHNLMMLGADHDMDEIFAGLLDKQSEIGTDVYNKIFEGAALIPKTLTEESVGYYLYVVLREFQKSEPTIWVKFQSELASYKLRLTNNNFDNEEKYFTSGSGLAFDATIQKDVFESERAELIKKRDSLERRLENIKDASKNDLSKKYHEKDLEKTKKDLKELNNAIRELDRERNSVTSGILKIHTPSEADKYIISDLNDSSTHGIINNIYNLLLTGLDVYVKKPTGNQKKYHDEIIKHTLGDDGTKLRKPTSTKEEVDYSHDAFGVDALEKTLAEREAEYKKDDENFDKWIYKIPGLKRLKKFVNNTTNKINNIGNNVLGEYFYSEHNSIKINDSVKKDLSKEEIKELEELKDKYDSASENDKKLVKKEIDDFINKIKKSKPMKSLKFGANIVTSAYNRSDLSKSIKALGSKLSKVSVKGKTLGEYISETKDSELIDKLSKATSVEEKINIIRDIGSDKAKNFANAAQKQYEENKSKFDSDFKDSEKGYTLDSIKSGLGKKLHKGLSVIQNKVLGSELYNLKDNKGNKLRDAISEIDSKVLNWKLANEPDPVEKCKILLNSDYNELKPFKPAIEEFRAKAVDELANSGSIKGILGNFKNKFLDTVKNKVGGKLAAMNQNRILSGDLIKLKNKQTGKTIGEIVAEINDPDLLSRLNSAKTVDEKINILLGYDNPQLNLCKQDLIDFKRSVAKLDTSFGGIVEWTKQRSKENTDNFIKNTLLKKLKKIKVGDKTLGEVLNEISKKDPSFAEKIESFTTITDLAEFLLQSDNPELLPYKKAIRELKDKHMDDEAQGGIAGVVGMGLVSGFDMIKKSIDKIKNLFKKGKKGDEELSLIQKYVHPDIIKLFGGAEQTLSVIDSLGIDVELSFKDNEYHKASKQIEFILEANKAKKFLNGKQKRALKGLMRNELDKESATSIISSVKNNISNINKSFQSEMEKYGKDMSDKERREAEEAKEESINRENKRLEKAEKQKQKANNRISKALGDEDGIEGNSAKEQREAKQKAKEDKLRFGFLSTLTSTLADWKKNGFKLDKDSTKDIKDAVSEGSSEGWSGKLSSFMDKTGLSNTKLGRGVKAAINGSGSLARRIKGNNRITSFLGKSKIGSSILGAVGKFGGGAAATAGAASGGASVVAGGAAAAGTGGLTSITKILEKLFKSPKVIAKVGKDSAKTIITAIKDGAKRVLTKIFPKLTALSGMASNFVGWAALVANALVSFTKGMARAKTTFNIGRGLRPTVGMRLACGLAAMLDGVLLGIPGIICKALGFRNAEEWFYSIIGKDSEKEAIKRYQKYNKMRSVIFGIDNPQSLVTYENRNIEKGGNFFDNLGSGAKRAGRFLANIATLGFAKNNDERDSSLLGFQSVDIYKMWKEKRYTPLTTECVDAAIAKLREEKKDDEILNSMDDAKLKKYLEQMNAVSKEDLDNNDDGEIDENAKAQAEAAALEHQNLYRKLYLEICRKYVLDNKIAWLNSHCDLEKFKKYTGQDAKTDLSKGDRAKRAASFALNPIGTAISEGLKKSGRITDKEAKTITKTTAALGIATLVAGPMGALAVGVGLVAKKAWKERKHIGRAIANAFRTGITKNLIMAPYKQMETNRKMFTFKSTKKIREKFVKKIIELVDKYGAGHIDEWKSFNDNLSKYSPEYNPTIGKDMAETFVKYASYKYTDDNGTTTDMVKSTLGVDIPKEHPKRDEIAIASGLVGWVMEYMSEVDGMCQSILGMTIKRLAVKMIVNGDTIGKLSNNYEKYVSKRAEILGAPQDKLRAYESGLKGGDKATGWGRFKAGFKSLFSKKDNDELDSQRIGFQDVKIYKYWKQHKYDPIINLEKQIAGKYGKYLEIIDKHCEDVEAQNKFIQEFILAATKYVNNNQLAWLTTKTTLDEFNEFEGNGFKTNASMSKSLAEERNKQRTEIEEQLRSVKKGSRQYKKLQKELNRMDMANNGSLSKNNIDLNKDFNALSKELLDGYDDAGLNAHETASDVIQNELWGEVGVNFYGNEELPNANPISTPGEEKGGPADMFGALGSNENLRILKEKVSNNAKQTLSNVRKSLSDTSNNVKNSVQKIAPGLADKVRSRVNIEKTPINDFVIDFKNELLHKLDILNEIHSEQVRHNTVSEEFYSALLNMVAVMAKSQGNSRIASQLDMMVKEVSK